MTDHSFSAEFAEQSIKGAPPALASTALIFGVSLQDSVLIVTLAYLALQIAYLIYKWGRDIAGPDGSITGWITGHFRKLPALFTWLADAATKAAGMILAIRGIAVLFRRKPPQEPPV